MSDLYLKLANAQLTQPLIQALNLPRPVKLERSPNDSSVTPRGNILVASAAQGFAANSIYKTLDIEEVTTFTARSSMKAIKLSAAPATYQTKCQEIQLDNISSQKFKALVFDASGISNAKDLKQLYSVFKHSVKQIRNNGRFVIIAQTPSRESAAELSAVQGSLIGFVKSLAKESGKKGITCNLINIERGAQKHLASTLNFFLSPKSAYVTGQSLALQNKTVKGAKPNAKQPLKGKTAIVTGAAQGIGRETAITLARDGATVVCLDIPANESKTKALANEIQGHSLSIDLSEASAVEQLCNVVGAQLGVIDIIVHNAGITRDKTLANMPEHFWDQVITINLGTVIDINTALIAKGFFAKNARIICVSSISGIAGNFGQSNYACSKAGIASYVEALSKEYDTNNLTINAIAPGFIETDMTQKIPLMTREVGRRMNALSQGGLPLDIAEGISLFCRPDAQALNGNVLRICGLSLLGK
jgi:3-oxoacyl-[acyl-carrier protein] reductase